MSLEKMKNAMINMVELGANLIKEKLDDMSDEEKNKIATEVQLKDLVTVLTDNGTATFLTQEDQLSIALIIANRGVIAMKKQLEETYNGK